MNRLISAGVVLTLGGLGAYLVGIYVAYPGRAFSITAVMTGVSLLAVGAQTRAEAEGN